MLAETLCSVIAAAPSSVGKPGEVGVRQHEHRSRVDVLIIELELIRDRLLLESPSEALDTSAYDIAFSDDRPAQEERLFRRAAECRSARS